jgi:hypothetical protein
VVGLMIMIAWMFVVLQATCDCVYGACMHGIVMTELMRVAVRWPSKWAANL